MQEKMTIVQVRQESGNSISVHALKSVFGRVLLGIVVSLLCSIAAHAQFIVQPMQINVQSPAGSLVRRSFKLENRDKLESHFVRISVVDLVQARDGSWAIFDSEMLTESNSGFNFEVHSSCKDWCWFLGGLQGKLIGRSKAILGHLSITINDRDGQTRGW